MQDDIVLKTEDLTKHYGGVHALDGANFELKKGEHVAIMGDNGAGKSTFVRQITGVEQRTRGKIWLYGKEVNFTGPIDAREAGIETVFQTLALADDLDVPDNLFLGRELTFWNWLGPFRFLDYKAMRQATIAGLEKTAVKIPNIKNTIRNMSGERVWLPKGPAQEREIDEYMNGRVDDDPDLWIVEIEDRQGRHFLTEPVEPVS